MSAAADDPRGWVGEVVEGGGGVVFELRTRPDLAVEYVSDGVEWLSGFAAGELLAERGLLSSLAREDDADRLAAVLALEPGEHAEVELRAAHRDGPVARLRLLAACIARADGSTVLRGVAFVETDPLAVSDAADPPVARSAGLHGTTTEAEALQSLARREREARDLAENSADVVLRTTLDGVIDWISPSVRHVLGWAPEEMIGRIGVEFLHRDSLPGALAQRERVDAGEAVLGRSRVRRKDGTYLWMGMRAKPVLDDDGRVVARVSGWRDVSAEVEYEQQLAESEQRYRLLAENASDVVFLGDTSAVLQWVSPSVRDLHGWEPDDLVGRPVWSLLHPDDLDRVRAASAEVNQGQRTEYEARFRRSDGSYRWMAVTLRPLTDSSGAVVGRVAAARDIEAERRTRDELAQSEERFRTALESAPSGMAVMSLDRGFVTVNPALCRLLGHDEAWLTRHGMEDVLDEPDDDLDRRMRADLLASGQRSLTREHQLVRSDGQRIWVEHSIGVVRADTGAATSFVSQFIDVTESRRARERLRFLAAHDSLTELMNRRELFARVDALLSDASNAGHGAAVLFLDLDGLKTLNDSHGHVVGDEVIREVAARIRSTVRAGDLVARYGGDEFIAVLPAVARIDDAVAVADKVHAAVREPVRVAGRDIRVTVSIGAALAQPGDDPDALLNRADAALYRAKRDGRDGTATAPRPDPIAGGP